MSISRTDVENIIENDLQELKDNAVGEGLRYDYKLDLYGPLDADKREFLKDASSFANTAGGDILIGVKEDQGLPVDILGVSADLDREKLRLENLLRDKIEPRILGIRMQPVDLVNGRRVLVIRIPKSSNPPHAVLQNKSRLIFARNSAGVHEASVDEMRSMFNLGGDLLDRAREFQKRRVHDIHEGFGWPFSYLSYDGRMIMHIIPLTAFSQESAIDLRHLEPDKLIPIWCHGCSYGYNVDGYWTTSEAPDRRGYVQVFRNGIIETAAADVRTPSNAGPYFQAETFENEITTHLDNYLSSLKRAGGILPGYVTVSGTRMGGHVFFNPHAPTRPQAQALPDHFDLPTILIEDFSTIEEYRQALKPLFDAIWNAAGYGGSRSYGSDGKWTRRS